MAKTCFCEGLNVETILRFLELEGFRINRSSLYYHFTKHDDVSSIRKSAIAFRRMRSKRIDLEKEDTNPMALLESLTKPS